MRTARPLARRECDALVAAAFASGDIKEAHLAFAEKRKPTFLGN